MADRYILTAKQKAAIKFLVTLWKRVDKRPSRVKDWYPSYVQMMSALEKMRKIIITSNLPTSIKNYCLHPLTDYALLESHSAHFYYEFDVHPSEYLETFICILERKTYRNNRKKKNKK